MPKILINSGDKKGQMLRVEQQLVTIGRDVGNTLVLNDRRISRQHIQIIPDKENYRLKDLGSVNGTFVNGQPVSDQMLKWGDEILLGSTRLIFLPLNAPEPSASEKNSDQDITNVRLVADKDMPKGLTVEVAVAHKELQSIHDSVQKADQSMVQSAYERLLLVYRISTDLGTIIDLHKLLERISVLVMEIIHADRSVIMLKDDETGDFGFRVVHVRRGVKERGEIAFSKTIAARVLETGESILTTDALSDERFQRADSIIHHGIRSAMCVPLKFKDKILGIMHVDTKGTTVNFKKEDLELLMTIANQAALAIESAMLFEELKRANVELKQQQNQLIEAEKFSALGQLASGVAHEINNPLTSILGYTELTAKMISDGKTSAKDLEEMQSFLKIVESESHRCQGISKSLLSFARKHKEEMKDVDIHQPVESSLVIAQFHIKRGNIKTAVEFDKSLPLIRGDSSQLQQVFLNLIINARDAMEKNGGTLTIKTRRRDPDHLEVRVSDTGCGIPEEIREKIFQPLFTSKEEGKGTGLGLSISQDIVERHGGTIEVESTVGKGTTFVIALPIRPQESKS